MQSELPSDDLLTVEEVAARLRLRPSWVYSHADDLGVLRLGKYLRFSWPRVLERIAEPARDDCRVGAAAQRPSESERKT